MVIVRVYVVVQFGMNALGDMINLEEHPHGIRCTNICPGEVATEILDKRAEPPPPERRAIMLQPEEPVNMEPSRNHA